MSGFFSLDEEEEDRNGDAFGARAMAGPSRSGAEQARQGDPFGTPATSRSLHNDNTATDGASTSRRRANPITALLDEEDGLSSVGGGSQSNAGQRYPSEDNEVGVAGASATEVGAGKSEGITARDIAPLVELRRAWANERAAPELLPWRGEAVDGVCAQIEEQMIIVDSLAADASTAEEEHIRLSLVELDVERARWLLRSYLRCRLEKIEQHAPFVSQDAPSRANLSELERGYAVRYTQICGQHFHASVLDFLPGNMRSLDDKAASGSPSGRGDMVTRPDLDAPVFVRCLADCGTFRFPGVEDSVRFAKDTIHLVRYQTVRRLIINDMVELL